MEVKLPIALERLIAHLSKIPGVGRVTAQRHAWELLRWKDGDLAAFADDLAHLHERVQVCPVCGNYTDGGPCVICADEHRDASQICVVETPMDIPDFERTGCYHGLYHVLGGKLSPLSGVGVEQLRIEPLRSRLATGKVRELILATSTDVDGEATARHLVAELQTDGVTITRLAVGVPTGASLAYAGTPTLARAITGRLVLRP